MPAAPQESDATGRPITFLQAAAFQWVNPKAWAMALTAVTVYAPERSVWAVALVAMVFGAVNLPSVSVWTVLGQQVRRVLTTGRRLVVFKLDDGRAVIASLVPVLWH